MALQETLLKVIEEWKAFEWIPGSKQYFIDKSPIKENEFMITFKIEASIKVGHQTNPIRAKKRFFTFAQNDDQANPEGDVHNLRILLDHIDLKFQKEIDNLISG